MTYPQPGLDPTRPQPPLPAVLGPYPPVSAPTGGYAPLPAMPYPGGGYPAGGQRLTVQPILTSGMATASLVLGILGVLGGWCLFGLPCVLAVILGHLALRETRDGMRSGHGMAVAGLVLGYVFVGPMILFTVMVFFGSILSAATPTP
ncbi:DUF4190 domain-containing protein [Micromonospora terminaliae]|uniref:DUF4190 domain-containing protein n=1 Tax=Micromonospora terminaliae TaxID=1914461 RepID=A0AAJ3DLH9_9ACTN|nr:DUF4190 domain-containing protein [Micromonospora terminaliae]NES28160.1 DUF4190 domain-containing protein [Micromonospora terminaliae]QGL47098.1 DUF4190 domain-containing protein [Micromonospora terminaliae]